MQIGKAARSNGSHIKSRLKMEPHGVFMEVTKQCTNTDHHQSGREDGIAIFDEQFNIAGPRAVTHAATSLLGPRESCWLLRLTSNQLERTDKRQQRDPGSHRWVSYKSS